MHKSRIFLLTLLSFVFGVGMRSFWEVPEFLVYGVAAFGCFLLVFAFSSANTRRSWIVGLCLLGCAFGILRFSLHKAAEADATVLPYANGGQVEVRGVVADDPDAREKNTRLVLEASDVLVDGVSHEAHGRVLLFVNRYPTFSYGDEIKSAGILQKPESFNDFDYPAYLAKDQIYTVMYYPVIEHRASGGGDALHRGLFQIKHAFEGTLERVVAEPHAAFLKGIILGSRASMPDWLLEIFRVTGVMHIIALSGFNITIIADNLTRALRAVALGPQWSFWVSLIAIMLFTIMTGASPSIVRAALMGVLILLARKEGRMYIGANALIFAGACMILQNPAVLRFDVAFQLSFLATAGLLFLSPYVEKYLPYVPVRFGLRGNLATTLAAQLTVLPLILYYFGTFSLVSIPANLLILIGIPYAMFFGLAAGTVGFISVPLGVGIGAAAHAVSFYIIAVASFFSRVPFAELHTGRLPSWAVVGILAGLLGLLLRVKKHVV